MLCRKARPQKPRRGERNNFTKPVIWPQRRSQNCALIYKCFNWFIAVKTISQAATVVNSSKADGPTTLKIAPGTYILTEAIIFQNHRKYTPQKRLTIEATVLPDDSRWNPILMPVIISTSKGIPRGQRRLSCSFKIEVNHTTIRGLKFLGNPRPRNWHYSIYRQGQTLNDLLITQCLFVGDAETIPSHCSIIANGYGLVLDHNIFYRCNIPVLFWNAEGGISKGNAMRYCIVDGASTAAVWTCDTADDFEFHHNVVTRSQYLWMRPLSNSCEYKIHDCVLTDNSYKSGHGSSFGITGPTGSDVKFKEKSVVREGVVTVLKPNIPGVRENPDRPKNYLHVKSGSLGSKLEAGLFMK